MLLDLAEAVNITTFRVWKNNNGKGRIKDFFKGEGESKKGEDKYPLQTMLGNHFVLNDQNCPNDKSLKKEFF